MPFVEMNPPLQIIKLFTKKSYLTTKKLIKSSSRPLSLPAHYI